MNFQIKDSWKNALQGYFSSAQFKKTLKLVNASRLQNTIYPKTEDMFRALEITPIGSVRVVILGQDPYHGPGQAMGLSFSVPDGARIPPSLQNIYKEIETDLGRPAMPAINHSGNLTPWAQQGVLLINSVLTVAAGQAASHSNFGWQNLSDQIIRTLSENREHIVFLLWGAYAQSKRTLINESKHLVLTAPHPSPLSAHRGFFGCRHFSQANNYLKNNNIPPINW